MASFGTSWAASSSSPSTQKTSPSSPSSCASYSSYLASPHQTLTYSLHLSLSWCDTTASTFGRMFGPLTPPLPRSLPLLPSSIRIPLPFARRKSTAGFLAASLTGAMIVFGFWTWLAPFGKLAPSLPEAVWDVESGAKALPLALVAAVSGVLAGVAEAIGAFQFRFVGFWRRY